MSTTNPPSGQAQEQVAIKRKPVEEGCPVTEDQLLDKYVLLTKAEWKAYKRSALLVLLAFGLGSFSAAWVAARAVVAGTAAAQATRKIENLKDQAERQAAELVAFHSEGQLAFNKLRAQLSNSLALAFQQRTNMPLDTWHLAESDGFALVNVGGNGGATAEMCANTSKEDNHGPSRVTVTGWESEFIIVRKGEYFKAERTKGPGSATLYWIPLFASP